MIRCPYCLEIVDPTVENKDHTPVYICPNNECKAALPRDLVEKKIPQATIGLVGFTGHGKTVYLTSLFYILKILRRDKRNPWGEDFNWESLDDNTHKIMCEHVPLFEASKLPDSTPENFPHPALIQFTNTPFFKNYFLSFYDTAGRVYEETEKIAETGRFVAHSEVVLFIISIKDCGTSWADKMESLLETYIRAVYDKLRVDLKKNQHLIVVLTKADSLIRLPTGLKNFLQNGSYEWYLVNNPNEEKSIVRAKVRELKEHSRGIKEWLEKNNCRGFTNLAKQKFKSVEYTIVSSTGAEPIGNRLATKLKPQDPKRVLDPFLWALEKTRPKGIWERIFNNCLKLCGI